MTDKELLELAAKAAGIKGEYYSGILNDVWVEGILYIRDDGQQMVWNPLIDDGDALRLAVKLHLYVDNTTDTSYVELPRDRAIREPHNGDPYAATRRAIVRAAAEIGKGK